MKIRRSDTEAQEIKLDMTAMIDVVFQLLIFFVMTFKTPIYEGDFSIKMPSLSQQPETMEPEILDETMTVTLTADDNRNLASINVLFQADDFTYNVDPNNPDGVFQALNDYVIALVGNRADPTEADIEVQLDAAYDLQYQYTIKTIEALSGHRNADGQVVQLIEKINFTNPAQ